MELVKARKAKARDSNGDGGPSKKDRRGHFRYLDRIFAFSIAVQWLVAIVLVLIISPQNWLDESSRAGSSFRIVPGLGGALVSLPIAMVFGWPGRPATRHMIAMSQMLLCALLINLAGGRTEAHFLVFVSLAFLAFYRDWLVVVTAVIVAVVSHFVLGHYWPEPFYGVSTVDPRRCLEHSSWIALRGLVLVVFCRWNTLELARARARNRSNGRKGPAFAPGNGPKTEYEDEAYLTAVVRPAPDAVLTVSGARPHRRVQP